MSTELLNNVNALDCDSLASCSTPKRGCEAFEGHLLGLFQNFENVFVAKETEKCFPDYLTENAFGGFGLIVICQ